MLKVSNIVCALGCAGLSVFGVSSASAQQVHLDALARVYSTNGPAPIVPGDVVDLSLSFELSELVLQDDGAGLPESARYSTESGSRGSAGLQIDVQGKGRLVTVSSGWPNILLTNDAVSSNGTYRDAASFHVSGGLGTAICHFRSRRTETPGLVTSVDLPSSAHPFDLDDTDERYCEIGVSDPLFGHLQFFASISDATLTIEEPEEPKRVLIYYVNGIRTDRDQAFTDWLVLLSALKEAYGGSLPDNIEVDFVHNPTGGTIVDAYEVVTQIFEEEGQIPVTMDELLDYLTGKETLKEGSLRIVTQAFSEVAVAAPTAVVVDDHLAEFRRKVFANGDKLLVIAHSQGNFLANAYHANMTGAERAATKIVSVATPSSFTAGAGPYTTDEFDDVIGLVPTARPANYFDNADSEEIADTFDPMGHSFHLYYLNPDLPSRDEILDQVKSAVDELLE